MWDTGIYFTDSINHYKYKTNGYANEINLAVVANLKDYEPSLHMQAHGTRKNLSIYNAWQYDFDWN
jgi:hypothetical protein